MIRWFKITFLDYCPECMVKKEVVGAGACWVDYACCNKMCKIGAMS